MMRNRTAPQRRLGCRFDGGRGARALQVRYSDGRFERFRVAYRDKCVLSGGSKSIFRSSERQRVIDYLIRAKRSDGGAELDERTPLGAQIADRVPLHMGTRLDDLKRVWYEQMDIRTTLAILTGSRAQPLDLVAEYFGA